MGQVIDLALGVPPPEKFAVKPRLAYSYSQAEAQKVLKTKKRVSRRVMRALAASKKQADEKQLAEDLAFVQAAFREEKLNNMTNTLEKWLYDSKLPFLAVPKEWYHPKHKKLSLVVNLMAYSVYGLLPTAIAGQVGLFPGLKVSEGIAVLPSAQKSFREVLKLPGSVKTIREVFSSKTNSTKAALTNFATAVGTLGLEFYGGAGVALQHAGDIVKQLDILKHVPDVAPEVLALINVESVKEIIKEFENAAV